MEENDFKKTIVHKLIRCDGEPIDLNFFLQLLDEPVSKEDREKSLKEWNEFKDKKEE